MQLNKILDEVIFKEVYKEVKVECELHYHPSELIKDIVEKVKADNDFRKAYKEELSEQLRKRGHKKSI